MYEWGYWCSIENGDIKQYINSDKILGNIHVVRDIKDYISYILTNFNNPPSLIATYNADSSISMTSKRTKNTVNM